MREKLSIKATAFAAAGLWGSAVLLAGASNQLWPSYGVALLDLVSSVYPGYHAGTGWASVAVGTLYALLDGAVAGTIFSWLYNICMRRIGHD